MDIALRDDHTAVPGDAHDRKRVHSRFPQSSKHCMAQGVHDKIAAENGATFAVDLRRRHLAMKVIDRGPQILFAFPVRKDQSGYSVLSPSCEHLAHAPHRSVVISDDLLRVEAIDPKNRGWLYAYLLAPQTRAMAKSAHYGHIIKHLETSHLDALPIPSVDDATALDFLRRVTRILELRNEGYRLTLEAEAQFEKALGPLAVKNWGEQGYAVKASTSFLAGRRRLDAARHNPGAATIHRFLAKHGQGFSTLPEAGYDVWVPGRYKRIPIEDGVIYRDSADLLEINPDLPKRYADCKFGDRFRGRVKDGWILVACSGQVYGIIGTAILATGALNDQVVSNHVLRAAPKKGSVPAGYIVTALTHPLFGRPLVKALAFGSSVPEIDGDDLAEVKIVRLKPSEESTIAEAAEQSAKVRAAADLLEREITADAEKIIAKFMTE